MTGRLDIEGSGYDVRGGGDQPQRNSSNDVGQQEQDRTGWREDGKALGKRSAKRKKRGRRERRETGEAREHEVLSMRDCFFFVQQRLGNGEGELPSRVAYVIPPLLFTLLVYEPSKQLHYKQPWLL